MFCFEFWFVTSVHGWLYKVGQLVQNYGECSSQIWSFIVGCDWGLVKPEILLKNLGETVKVKSTPH